MIGFIVRLAVNILALWVAAALVPGMHIYGASTFILAGILLGVVNALIRPVLLVLTLPFTILTLGLFVLILNAAMLALVSVFLEDFTLSGFPAAFWGALVVSLTSWFTSALIGPSGSVEVMVSRSQDRND
ncbi:MAG: phage holin family protein [Myxococcota bacterium]|nr:phage holin family protein [Myxococcota bacterium]